MGTARAELAAERSDLIISLLKNKAYDDSPVNRLDPAMDGVAAMSTIRSAKPRQNDTQTASEVSSQRDYFTGGRATLRYPAMATVAAASTIRTVSQRPEFCRIAANPAERPVSAEARKKTPRASRILIPISMW